MIDILMATDLSADSDLAQRRAELLAETAGGALRIVHVRTNDTAIRTDNATIENIAGDPYDIISDLTPDVDLLVLGEPRRRTAGHLFTGTTGERIIRRSTAPVLVVRTEATRQYRRVLLAVDLTADSLEIMRTSKSLGLTSALCDVVYAYESPQADMMIEAATYSFDDIRRHISHQHRDYRRRLKMLMKEARLSGGATAIAIRDSAASTILSHAKKIDADLIVLGSRRRSNLARLVLGSVAAQVLSHASADVLIVPPASD